MKIAIVTVTENGKATGKKIRQALEGDGHKTVLFCHRASAGPDTTVLETPISESVGRMFAEYRSIVFVTALGIAVRAISRHIKDKRHDPAVVAVDEMGTYAISVLSGHHGANELARTIARHIGAEAVITTATEVCGRPSVEGIADRFNLVIDGFEHVKAVNASIVNGREVRIFSEFWLDIDMPENMSFHHIAALENGAGEREIESGGKDGKDGKNARDGLTGIVITNRVMEALGRCVILRPKNLIVGVGARRGIPKGAVLNAVRRAFGDAGLSPLGIACMATVDFKAGEQGIREAAEELGVMLKGVPVEDIKRVEGQFRQSNFVLEKVGIGAVCEPAAVLGGKGACTRLILGKRKFNGVTIAVAEERWDV